MRHTAYRPCVHCGALTALTAKVGSRPPGVAGWIYWQLKAMRPLCAKHLLEAVEAVK